MASSVPYPSMPWWCVARVCGFSSTLQASCRLLCRLCFHYIIMTSRDRFSSAVQTYPICTIFTWQDNISCSFMINLLRSRRASDSCKQRAIVRKGDKLLTHCYVTKYDRNFKSEDRPEKWFWQHWNWWMEKKREYIPSLVGLDFHCLCSNDNIATSWTWHLIDQTCQGRGMYVLKLLWSKDVKTNDV